MSIKILSLTFYRIPPFKPELEFLQKEKVKFELEIFNELEEEVLVSYLKRHITKSLERNLDYKNLPKNYFGFPDKGIAEGDQITRSRSVVNPLEAFLEKASKQSSRKVSEPKVVAHGYSLRPRRPRSEPVSLAQKSSLQPARAKPDKTVASTSTQKIQKAATRPKSKPNSKPTSKKSAKSQRAAKKTAAKPKPKPKPKNAPQKTKYTGPKTITLKHFIYRGNFDPLVNFHKNDLEKHERNQVNKKQSSLKNGSEKNQRYRYVLRVVEAKKIDGKCFTFTPTYLSDLIAYHRSHIFGQKKKND